MNDLYRSGIAATVVLTATGFATWQLWRRPPSLERMQRGYTVEYGAYLDPSFLAAMHARARSNRWSNAIATFATAAGGAVLVWRTDLEPMLAIAAIPSGSLVLGSLRRLAVAGREFVVAGSSSAVARPRRVVLSDYVSLPAQLLTWISVSLAVLAAVAVLRRHDDLGGTASVVVAGGATAILAEAVFVAWFGRVLCERPTPAVDASHLYLQDASRASALNGVQFQLRMSALLLTQGIAMSSSDIGSGLSAGLVVSSLVILVAAQALPALHFRARLWPTLLPGQVLMPGQAVPARVGAPA